MNRLILGRCIFIRSHLIPQGNPRLGNWSKMMIHSTGSALNKGNVAAKTPKKVDLVKGQEYKWCACGMSKKQPWCDGSHKNSNGISPIVFIADESKEAFLCRCKQTDKSPYCDGTHKNLP